MLAFGALPGLVLAIGMLVLPESHRWLAGDGRLRDAEVVLKELRGSIEVSGELSTLRTDLAWKRGRLLKASELLARRLRRPVMSGVGLAIFREITGINAVIYVAPTIFRSAGLSSAATSILATAGVRAVNVIVTLVAVRLIDRLGRRQLLFCSLAAMAATLFVLASAFLAGPSGHLAWAAVLSVAGFVAFFAIRVGPVFWLLIAEIFPLALCARAMSVASVANWSSNRFVSATCLNLVGAVGSAGAFLVYAVLSLVALGFIVLMVPETRGRSLEQIEAALEGGHALTPALKETAL